MIDSRACPKEKEKGSGMMLMCRGHHRRAIIRSALLLSIGLFPIAQFYQFYLFAGITRAPLIEVGYGHQSPKRAETEPELFMDRLNRLLPLDSDRRLLLDDIAAIDVELMRFDIPTNITVHMLSSEYVSIQMWRWLFADQEGAFATHERRHMCPRCRMYFPPWADGKNSKKIFQKNKPAPGKNADVLLNMGCPRGAPAVASAGVNLTNQILIGGCGESQDGTGAAYAKYGRQHYHYNCGFHDMEDGSPFQTSYAHLHLSPNGKFGYPELWNVTDMARQMLSPPPFRNKSMYDATFIHNDCGGSSGRGRLLKAATQKESDAKIARYGKCLHNTERPEWIAKYDGKPCAKRSEEYFLHDDCEATRDGKIGLIDLICKMYLN